MCIYIAQNLEGYTTQKFNQSSLRSLGLGMNFIYWLWFYICYTKNLQYLATEKPQYYEQRLWKALPTPLGYVLILALLKHTK